MNSKQSNKKQMLLSVLALLVILLVGAGVTYSWIEGGTTYSIETANKGDVRTGDAPYTDGIKDSIILDPSTTTQINLVDYDQNINKDTEATNRDLFFSPVLSANGSDFFFPTEYDSSGNATSYRKSNTNDIGTKFINYKFNVQAEKKCYVAFNGTPTVSVTKSGVTVSDTSAFRIMIRSGDDRVIMTTASTAQQTSVVTSESGTTATLTAQPIGNYLYKDGDSSTKLFDYNANESEEMEVSVWLDGETADSDLIGSDVKLNMDLIVAEEKVKISFDAVTYSNEGTVESNGFTGGKIDGNSAAFDRYYVYNTTVSATATANTNYKFVGWYSDKACTTLVSSVAALSKTATEQTTYYAKFEEKPEYTIAVSSNTLPSGTGGTVTVNGSGTTYTGYQDTTTTIKATASSGYKFVGWYTDSACTGTVYSTSASVTVTISGNKTYYAKFLKTYTVTFGIKTDGVTGGGGGTVQIDGGTASTSVSTTVGYNTSITLNATANDGYEFKGIYKSDGTLVTSLSTITQSITSATSYYAYFETKPASTTTIYFETRSGFSTYSVWAYQTVDGVTTHYSGSTWPGESATYDSETGYYKYEFETTDIGTFNVIVSNNGSSQYPASGSEGLEGTIGKTYLFKADNTLVEFDPDLKYTLTVLPSGTGGSATVNGASSATVYPGTSVTITATASSGYKFVGWYTDSDCTTTIGSTYTTASQSVSVTATTTYYAKFEVEDTTRKIYFTPNSEWKYDSARFACYVWADGMTAKWYSMSDGDGDGIYSATIDKGYTGIIFCRMDPSNTTNSWDTKWNQTGDLTIPTDGKNHYTKTSSTWDGDTSGTWSTYS